MPEPRQQRRLAAILAADVVGYTRAMGTDEAATHAQLQALIRDTIRPAVTAHGGRVFKEMGDGSLAEFSSAVDAAQCAAEIQAAQAAAEAPLKLRIGLHLGDVIVEGDDLFGDGVNIAARLQGEAAPGGVIASGAFRQQVEGRAGLGFADAGTRTLKNVAEPVQVFTLQGTGAAPTPKTRNPRRRFALAAVTVALLAGLIFLQGPNFFAPAPPRANGQPTVAVLPFSNLSQDPDQAFFGEGLAEDLITDLSKLSGVQVISRTSSFAVDAKLPAAQIGSRLNARYIVTGSVRRAGEQLRITANLIDSQTDQPLWADRFDGARADVFGFQDQITGQIIEALRVKLTPAEEKAVSAQGTADPAAYDFYLRGMRLLADRRRLDTKANAAAQAAFEDAIRIDPDYALAYAGLAWAKWLYFESINLFGGEQEKNRIFTLAKKSLAIEDNALAHRTLARRHFVFDYYITSTKKVTEAVAELEAARQLLPSDPDVLADLATILSFAGRPGEALQLVRKAMELNPSHPDWYFAASGIAFLLTEQPEFAIRDLQRWSNVAPSWPTPHLFLASAHGLAGHADAAMAALDRFSVLIQGSRMTFYSVERKWPMEAAEQEIFFRGLAVAGMKDTPG